MEEKEQKQKVSTPLVLQKSSYNIFIPEKVESMIRILCSEVHDVEWSGALFYTYKGSFEDNNLEITCQDICVMDIGTGGYTEFIESPAIINYQMEHDLLDCKVGLIHSHNNMATFFSGTDTGTLREEGDSMNNFVSLIVNNAGTYTAAITRKVKAIRDIRESLSYKFFGEGVVDAGSSQYYNEDTEIQYFPLTIHKETGTANNIIARLEEIKKSKSASVKSVVTFPKINPFEKETKGFSYEYVNVGKESKPKTTKQNTAVEDSLFDFVDRSYQEQDIKIDTAIIKSAALQIITGNILATVKANTSIKPWVGKVDSTFDDRFPDIIDFEYWADGFVDIILVTTRTNLFGKIDGDTEMSLLAQGISDLLTEYAGKSEYINRITIILSRYII